MNKFISNFFCVIEKLRKAAYAANLARNGQYDRAQALYK